MTNHEIILSMKRDIQASGRMLWDKDLVTGLNGNISSRVDENKILITATKTCLGFLQEHDVLLMDLEGKVLENGQASSERLLHTEIYKNFPDVAAVVHTHTTYTNAYFLENEVLSPSIFESRFYLGEVKAIAQATPAVSDVAPVIGAFKSNNIVVLKNHGVVAMGKNLFDCFLLIQCLEDAVKIDAISRLYKIPLQLTAAPAALSKPAVQKKSNGVPTEKNGAGSPKKSYKLFSPEQIAEIVRLVNNDEQMRELGAKTKMNMDLAVKNEENGKIYSFHFEQGKITEVGKDEGVEFLISASEAVWRSVFSRELDPFVATTQKKMNLRGDFAKISKWYAPCSRIFEIWAQVPVE